MNKPIRPFHILIKALLLFILINLIYAWINPKVGSLTLVNHILPGTERFSVLNQPVSKPNGTIGTESSRLTNMDVLFSAHEINIVKSEDEYRVVAIGDSSMWGAKLSVEQTLVDIINEAGLKTCTGLRIHVYNLGYPTVSVLRDLMILERANAYNPDMFILTFSLNSFLPNRNNEMVEDNLVDYDNLVNRYNLETPYTPVTPFQVQDFWDKTLWGQRKALRLQIQVQAQVISNYIYGTDDVSYILSKDKVFKIRAPASGTKYNIYQQTDNLFKSGWLKSFDTLRVANEITNGKPLLLINEPIAIATGKNSDIRYNVIFPRWAYDQYLSFLDNLTTSNQWIYRDYWDLLPQSDFINTITHRNYQGNQDLAKELIPLILENSCK